MNCDIVRDRADELQRAARMAHARITVDTSGLAPEATELANELARRIRTQPRDKAKALLETLSD